MGAMLDPIQLVPVHHRNGIHKTEILNIYMLKML